ncbi:glycosyltransferase family 39 protein [bacterium]|nr:glycosyltransferase family 39 protein [bacterium]
MDQLKMLSAILAAIVAALAIAIAWKQSDGERNAGASSSIIPLLWTLLSVLAVDALFRSGIDFLQGGDEYARAMYATYWSIDPFFAPPDHIWLAGQFYILGALARLVSSMPLAVAATSIAGTLATTYFAYRLGTRLWKHPIAGVTSGLLAGTHWVVLWASVNPHAEVFFLPALLAGIERWVAGWQATDEPIRAERRYLAAAAWFAFGTMFRFEMWYVGILFGCFLIFRIGRALFRKDVPNANAWYPLVGCVLLMTYPACWMISSTVHLGSPLGFAKDATQMNTDTNMLYDFSTPWTRFVIYPKILVQDHWNFLVLPAAAGVFALVRRRRLAFYIVAWAILLLFSMVITLKAGVGSNNRPRYTMFLLLPLIGLGAGLPALLWDQGRGALRIALRAAVVLLLVVFVGWSARYGRANYPNAYGYSPEALMVFDRLEHEWDNGRPWVDGKLGYLPIQPPDTALFVMGIPGRGEDHWMAMYHSHWPDRVYPVWNAEGLLNVYQTAAAGSRVLVRQPAPEIEVPERAHHRERIGTFDLWIME